MVKPRRDHFSTAVDRKIYVFGGYRDRESKLEGNVYSFDQSKGWQAQAVKPEGRPHPSLHSGACASLGHCLYIYGGEIDTSKDDGPNFQNSLYRLDTHSFEWTELPSGPKKMTGCRMVSFANKLILFGGYGYPLGPTQPGTKFERHDKYEDGRGWTNELHVFNVQEGEFQGG